MIRIQPILLPDPAARSLEALQNEVSTAASYAERVHLARQRFEAENRPGNVTFEVVRSTLASMCAGACRCMYCEDSMAAEVEHFRPKAFYPDLVFVWINYLYTCGPCNRIKRHHFRIVSENAAYVDLLRRRIDPLVEPIAGQPVLLDPRSEDPLEFLTLDLVDTFWFVPRHRPGSHEHERASYTIARLKLNERDALAQARKEAYGAYKSRLAEYVAARGTARAARLASAVSNCGHRAVWAEMKAQADAVAELAALFGAAPEARHW